jgi:hypothetical protein
LETLSRALLFLFLISDTTVSMAQRQEMFLDIYGNAAIRERTALWLDEAVQDIIR